MTTLINNEITRLAERFHTSRTMIKGMAFLFAESLVLILMQIVPKMNLNFAMFWINTFINL